MVYFRKLTFCGETCGQEHQQRTARIIGSHKAKNRTKELVFHQQKVEVFIASHFMGGGEDFLGSSFIYDQLKY